MLHGFLNTTKEEEYEELDNEPNPGESKVSSEISASRPSDGKESQSNTSASDRQSSNDRNVKIIYKPDRGNRGSEGTNAAALLNHAKSERAPTAENPPYTYENGTEHYKPPGSRGSRAGRHTSTAAPFNYFKSKHVPSNCKKTAEDQSYTYKGKTEHSNTSKSTSFTARVAEIAESAIRERQCQN
ncbi:hypothetical protein BOTCAL_0107g00200 [Botryotinia calthae]|uniref:Uncharacterized protein n=1 Tax=Botryotinia calthae TaxID=38488 RepID=A0A4Y8D820_9HELO|nr:hypothetical protein BOTCAL_0107g00200 [Botryotinia calthae]